MVTKASLFSISSNYVVNWGHMHLELSIVFIIFLH